MQPVDGKMAPLCVEQFEQADNMTDTSSAIRALTGCAAEAAREPAEKALKEFYNRWVDEALVIDQWFTIQASCQLPGTLDRVKSLMEHAAFDIRNPNRVRALVNGFTLYNNVNFHSADGSGYEFLADRVLELDQFNPMVAARILGPLTRWRKFDVQRRKLMTEQLERIKETENLSRDVFEIVIVSKSLQPRRYSAIKRITTEQSHESAITQWGFNSLSRSGLETDSSFWPLSSSTSFSKSAPRQSCSPSLV